MNIVMITGAGISTGAGLDTYRGADGRYTELEKELGMPVEQLLSPGTLRDNPTLIWTYWLKYMPLMRKATPSRAHEAIVQIAKLAGNFLEVTQNVDGLSRKAGLPDEKLIELHGSYHRFVCTRCKRVCHPIVEPGMAIPPKCFSCDKKYGAVIRPDVVMFGEMIGSKHYGQALDAARQADILIISGTTLQFSYLGDIIVRVAENNGRIIYVDPQASAYKNVFLVADFDLNIPDKVECIKTTADEGLWQVYEALAGAQQ